MHRRAEYGVAAHWKYKESAKGDVDPTPTGNDMQWLRQLVDWQKETADPSEFLDSLRFEIAGSEVYVFTPKGDVIGLPSGSTPVDFAYAVHTEVGHRTMGARVNGRLVPLDSSLENGDVVDVFTSKSETAGPSRDWLGFVKSPRARNKIRQWFSKERREEAIEHGKDAIAKAMRKQNLPIQRLLSHESLVALANEMRYADVSALYAAIGEGQVSAATVVQRLVQSMGGETAAEEDLAEVARPGSDPAPRAHGRPGRRRQGRRRHLGQARQVLHAGAGRRHRRLRHPRRRRQRAPHRLHQRARACGREPERMVDVPWSQTSSSLFLVQIQVEALDRSRLLSDVTRVLSDSHVNILSASVSTSRDRVALSRFVFEMAEPSHLASVLAAVRKVEGVFDVYRDHRRQGRRGARSSAPDRVRGRSSAGVRVGADRPEHVAGAEDPAMAGERSSCSRARSGSNPACAGAVAAAAAPRGAGACAATSMPGALHRGDADPADAHDVVARPSVGLRRRSAAGAGRSPARRAARRAPRRGAAGGARVHPDARSAGPTTPRAGTSSATASDAELGRLVEVGRDRDVAPERPQRRRRAGSAEPAAARRRRRRGAPIDGGGTGRSSRTGTRPDVVLIAASMAAGAATRPASRPTCGRAQRPPAARTGTRPARPDAGAAASAAGVLRGALHLLEPRATGVERGLGVGDPARVAGRLRLGRGRPRARRSPARAARRPPRRARASRGCVRRHCAWSVSRTAVSTARRRPSTRWTSPRGTLPAASQRSWIRCSACLAAARSRDRHERLGLDEQGLLDLEVRAELLVGRGASARRARRRTRPARRGTGPTGRRRPRGWRGRRPSTAP